VVAAATAVDIDHPAIKAADADMETAPAVMSEAATSDRLFMCGKSDWVASTSATDRPIRLPLVPHNAL
jgi:hypothetical protein